MRIGIKDMPEHESPEQWGELLAKNGYRSCAFPITYRESVSKIDAYVKAAKDYDILIAEVGVWNSPNHPDEHKAKQAKEDCLEQFRLAEYIEATCCVNVSGAAGELWYGCYRENYSEELYKKNVEFVQYLCDTVKPMHTVYALEPMQWMLPHSPEQYAQFIKDVGNEHCKVHMDIMNFINSPYKYTHQDELIDHAFLILQDKIVSCHIKDITMRPEITVMFEETPVGTGEGNLSHYIRKIRELDANMPVLLEHMHSMDEYNQAFQFLSKNFNLN